jgi:hypothetical protein
MKCGSDWRNNAYGNGMHDAAKAAKLALMRAARAVLSRYVAYKECHSNAARRPRGSDEYDKRRGVIMK